MAKFHRLNEHIQALKLRVIGPDSKQLGILTKAEALEKARGLKLDLIEVAPQADPPVARIFNFQKFKYEESKREKGAKKRGEGGLKELWLSPRIADHDLQVRLDRTKEFFKEGYKVKLTVKFKGREMSHPELGHKVLKKALDLLGDQTVVEREPRFEGRRLSMIITKSRGGKKDHEQNEDQKVDSKETDNNVQG